LLASLGSIKIAQGLIDMSIKLGLAVFALLFVSHTLNAQNKAALSVGGDVEKPLQLTLADLSKMPHRSIKTKSHDGKDITYEGVELHEVLSRAGVKFGEQMRGKAVANYVLIQAADKYEAVFALAELDPAFTDRLILLADSADGKPLPESNGPLQIVVPDEKRHARWVRQVVTIAVKSPQ
jgi:DMSO/TMAO reductase YedYZ molybdopterin-dependent catalytic subunit